MKEGVIYEDPGITGEERKKFKQFTRDMQKIDHKRNKMTPEERAKQDKEFAGLHLRMQAGIEE